MLVYARRVNQCQICGKRACVFLTQVVNGKATDLQLCEDCAREKGLFDPKSLAFAEKFFPEELRERVDKIVRELSGKPGDKPARRAHTADLVSQCPACLFTLDDYRRTSRFGCPDCYTVFARELNATSAEAMTADTAAAPAETQRASLERRLREAIEREDYETAAKLRDQLKTLP